MSRIEEALEKASRLRGKSEKARGKEPERFSNVKEVDISNQLVVTVTDPDSPIAEEYRRLKSMVLRETKSNFLNTIMMTSSIASEGKSLTSINLAVSLAQEIDHSIILVDADLRKPMIHEYLGIQNECGLSEYLTQDIDISEVLVRTGIGKLVVIPAGKMVENPVELLSSDKMKNLVTELKQRYADRYVIIDTPPILSCAEGLTIGSYVDGIIFVIQEGKAQRKSVVDALNMIKKFKILGLVFNNVGAPNLEGHYNQYYYQYKK